MFNRDLNTILKTFTKIQRALDTFIEKAENAALDARATARAYETKAEALQTEVERAAKVLKNIADIVG